MSAVITPEVSEEGPAPIPADPIRGNVRRFAYPSVLIVATLLFLLDIANSNRYGFHRDELYFLDSARHLQGGYVDQPIFVPLLARMSLMLFGVSLPGLRLWAALAVAATVIVAALIARELGGGRAAQMVAAIAVACMPALIAAGDLLEPTTFDILFWSALTLVLLRIARTGDQRYWLLAGFVLGLGVANKHSIAFFAGAVVVGLVLSGGWRGLLNRWALAGLVIAILFTLPDFIWQAEHGWPTIAMTQALNQENGGFGNIPVWIIGQLLMVNVFLLWLWIKGLRVLWKSGIPMWRALVWAYAILFDVFALTTGGKIYYLAAAYVFLLAAGAVGMEGLWRRHKISTAMLSVAVFTTTVFVLPIVLPILPATKINGFTSLNSALSEEIGWPQLVHTVDRVWTRLPAQERRDGVIFTSNYGEAGAINELGRGMGMPTAVSGHNNEWFWGPGNPHASTVVAVMPGPVDWSKKGEYVYLKQFFHDVSVAATIRNPYGVHNQEWDGHVFVCTEPREPWGAMWPRLRQYS